SFSSTVHITTRLSPRPTYHARHAHVSRTASMIYHTQTHIAHHLASLPVAHAHMHRHVSRLLLRVCVTGVDRRARRPHGRRGGQGPPAHPQTQDPRECH